MARKASHLPVSSAAQGRRLLLGAQGLLAAPRLATTDSTYDMVEQLGFVQVDSINVVERAHHLILAPRLRGYRPSLLQNLLERQRRLFEHWTHDAAVIPLRWYPYWQYRFDRFRERAPQRAWWRERMGGDPAAGIARGRQGLGPEGAPVG